MWDECTFMVRLQVTCRLRRSELPVTGLEVSGPVETGSAAAHPVGDPGNHLSGADTRIAEEPMSALAVGEKGVVRLGSLEGRRPAEMLAEFLGDAPHAQE